MQSSPNYENRRFDALSDKSLSDISLPEFPSLDSMILEKSRKAFNFWIILETPESAQWANDANQLFEGKANTKQKISYLSGIAKKTFPENEALQIIAMKWVAINLVKNGLLDVHDLLPIAEAAIERVPLTDPVLLSLLKYDFIQATTQGEMTFDQEAVMALSLGDKIFPHDAHLAALYALNCFGVLSPAEQQHLQIEIGMRYIPLPPLRGHVW